MAHKTPSSQAAILAPERLLEHVGWVRALAQRLVRDPHAADDLTQETMLAAIETPGQQARSPRAWLGRVLRNVLWERVRQDRRREARERATMATANTETVSSADLVERVDAHRSVVDAVMRLPEHYRIVLLRRYFEGETPTQIAAALAMPIATVKTRLQRGLERMREELDATYGERERWQPALLGLLGVPRRAATVSLPVAAAAAVLLALGATLAWSQLATATDATPVPATLIATAGSPANVTENPQVVPLQRQPVASSVATAVDWGDIKMPPRPVRGVAVTPNGQPVAGALLRFEADRPERSTGRSTPIVLTAADGSFEFELRRSGMVVAVPGELTTICAGVVNTGRSHELCVVVAPGNPLSGRIVDPHGNGLQYARVTLKQPSAMRARLGASSSSAAAIKHTTETVDDGNFAFELLPFCRGCSLRIEREGYAAQLIDWHGDGHVEIMLQPPPPADHEVTGLVLDPGSNPVANARVACGTVVTRSDRTGRFRLPVPTLPAGATSIALLAVADGYGAGITDSTAIDDQQRPSWPDSLELRLTAKPLSVHGRVLFADGRPAPRARVWIANPTLFAHTPDRRQETTALRITPRNRQFLHGWPETVESIQSGASLLEPVMTDADGRFELHGLCARSYQLIGYDFSTSQRSASTTVMAGAESIELRLRSEVRAKIEGRVVDRLGNAIAGASVSLKSKLLALSWGGRAVFTQLHLRGAMRTGPDGSFWLFDVPREHVTVRIDGPGILPLTIDLSGDTLTAVATRRSLITVQCADGEAVDSVGAIDLHGEAVRLRVRRGDATHLGPRVPMHEGRTETFELPDDAVEVLGYRGDEIRYRTTLVQGMRTIDW